MRQIIPGFAGVDSLRALAIVPANEPPDIEITRNGVAVRASVATPPGVPQQMLDAVRAEGSAVWLVTSSGLEAGSEYQLGFPGRAAPRTTVRTLPAVLPREGLTIAVASCFYEGFNMAARFGAALKEKPFAVPAALKILCGDNLYLDIPQLEGSEPWTAVARRYLQQFRSGAYAEALRHLPTVTTYDDHEFWNNYPEAPFRLLAGAKLRKSEGLDRALLAGVDLFQRPLNPPRIGNALVSHAFSIALQPDAAGPRELSFFVTDVRSRRTTYDEPTGRKMLPEADLLELELWASRLRGPGVLVLGQPLWLAEGDIRDRMPIDYEEQYARIWRAIADANHDILLVSGDIHFSRVLQIPLHGRRGPREIFEFVTSPTSHIPTIRSTIGMMFGGSGTRDAAETVSFPMGLKMPVRSGPPIGPVDHGRYLFGTTCANTIGFLHFVDTGAGVDVGMAFQNLMNGRYPASEEGRQEIAWRRDPKLAPKFVDECRQPKVCTLR